MATYESNLDGKANVGSGGGGGTDTYTAPNEYFVDPTLAVDATKRQYQTIEAALLAAVGDDPIILRLAENQDHDWDGTNLAGAGVDVIIYSMNPPEQSETRIVFPNPTALLSDNGLTLRNVSFSGTANVTVGVEELYLDHCSGVWIVTTVNQPTPSFKTWVWRYCDLQCQIDAGAGETSDGSLTAYDCRLTNDFDTFWDHTLSTEDWTLRFVKCLVEIQDMDGDPFFADVDGSSDLDVGFTDCKVMLYGDFSPILLKTGNNGVDWDSCRISESVIEKSGGSFNFGDSRGSAIDLNLALSGSLPVDGPIGMTAQSLIEGAGSGKSFGQVTFGDTLQWRFANNVSRIGGVTISSDGVPESLPTAVEEDYFINLDPPSSEVAYTLKGRIFAYRSSGTDTTIWDTDILVQGDGSPDTLSIRAGLTPTIFYEDNPGRYDLVITPGGAFNVQDVPVVASSLTVNGVTLTSNAGPRTPGSDDFDGSLATRELIALDIIAAINDAANSFVGVCTALASDEDTAKVNIISDTTGTLTLSESGSDLTVSGIGLSYTVTRNAGGGFTRVAGAIQIEDARFFL